MACGWVLCLVKTLLGGKTTTTVYSTRIDSVFFLIFFLDGTILSCCMVTSLFRRNFGLVLQRSVLFYWFSRSFFVSQLSRKFYMNRLVPW